MANNSVYRVTDLVGTSKVSWEDAVKNAVQTAGKTLRDLRVGEVSRLDVTIEKGKVTDYRGCVDVEGNTGGGGSGRRAPSWRLSAEIALDGHARSRDIAAL